MSDIEKLTLQDVVDLLADKQRITKKDAEVFVREFIAVVSSTLEDKDFVRIKNFGTFKLSKIKARGSVDVNTGEAIEIPAHYRLNFTPDKELRDGVNRPFSHFESVLWHGDDIIEDEPVTKLAEKKQKESEVIEEKATTNVPKARKSKLEVQKEEPKGKQAVVKTVYKQERITSDTDEDSVELSSKNNQSTKEGLGIQPEVSSAPIVKEESKKEALSTSYMSSAATDVKSLSEEEKIELIREMVRKSEKTDEEIARYQELQSQQKKKRFLWVGRGILIAVLIFGIYYWVNNNFSISRKPFADTTEFMAFSDDDSEADTVKKEETATQVADKIKASSENKTKLPQEEYEVEVERGENMSVLGQKYYGKGVFWVYIFEENKDKIAHPSALYAGAKLRIAPPSKYGIDPDSEASIAEAKSLEMKILREFEENSELQ